MKDWLRENYGWNAKREIWYTIIFALFLLVAVAVVRYT